MQPIKRWSQNWNWSITKQIYKRQKRSCFKIVNSTLKGFQISFEKNTVFCIDFIKGIKVRLPIQHKSEITLLKRCFLGIWVVSISIYSIFALSVDIYNFRMINLYTVIWLLNKYLLNVWSWLKYNSYKVFDVYGHPTLFVREDGVRKTTLRARVSEHENPIKYGTDIALLGQVMNGTFHHTAITLNRERKPWTENNSFYKKHWSTIFKDYLLTITI